MKRNVFNSPRLSELKKQKQRIFFDQVLIFMLGLGLAIAFLSYLSRIDRLNIDAIEITGNKIIETEEIKEVVEKEILGYYIWVFPKSNIFLYPKNHIQKTLNQRFKRLRNIAFSMRDRKILEISVTERVPKYTWCGTTLPESNTDNGICYFLDETGYIFDEAPYFSGEVYFKLYGPVNLADDSPAGSYFSSDIFQKLISFKEILENLELKPMALYVQEKGDAKMYLSSVASSVDPEIIFKKDADFEKIAENLEAALTTEPLQTDFKKKYSTLQYIDLRFGNKVYYKFK
jgi:hypothetical protein